MALPLDPILPPLKVTSPVPNELLPEEFTVPALTVVPPL
jgi:hypothetical protein